MKQRKLRLSNHRIKILEYLLTLDNHPTVDRMYLDLKPEIASLSKTTIYNTLDALIRAKLVKVISIEDNEARYEAVTINHGHFRCDHCGDIVNFAIDIDRFESKDLSGFLIEEKHVFFKGICHRCLSNKENL